MLNMNVEVEIEITKVGAKVFLRFKFMPFEKAAVMVSWPHVRLCG